MGEKLTNLLRQPLFLIGLGIVLLTLLTGAGWGVMQTQTPPPQPLEFRHNLHVGFGIQCLYCHAGALTGRSAGLPTNAKCWACHQQLKIYADGTVPFPPDLQILADFVERDEPVPWVPVAIMPEYVYFSHRPHVAYGLNCEQCHGEISQMTVALPQAGMHMGWCLDCHKTTFKDDPVRLTKLTDCSTCHQ